MPARGVFALPGPEDDVPRQGAAPDGPVVVDNGTPYLTVALDFATRSIVAFSLGFNEEPPLHPSDKHAIDLRLLGASRAMPFDRVRGSRNPGEPAAGRGPAAMSISDQEMKQ